MTDPTTGAVSSYNLLDEPWIPARLLDGSEVDLSLVDVLERAHEIRTLGGEVPTQYAAIVRLLLAVLHRAVAGPGMPEERWAELWRRGCFDRQRIESYVERFRVRFDLVHDTTPFFQVAQLRTAKGEYSSPARLVVDLPAGHQFFTTRAPASVSALSLAEAARWVVHAQAYEPSGIKSGAVGDDRVRGGRGYPIGIAPAGWLGLVVLEGGSLFETLLLNLDLRDPGGRADEPDSPVWEREPHGPAVETRSSHGPRGVTDLLTWQSRRIRLIVEDRVVTGVLVANGDPLHPNVMYPVEPMTVWRRSPTQEKATGRDRVMMPRAHVLERQIWRGLSGLLNLAPTGSDRTTQPSGTVDWLAFVRDQEALPDGLVLRARGIGVEYGSMSSVVDDLYDDALAARAEVLLDPELALLAVDAVSDADRAVAAYGDLVRNLVLAAGGDVGGRRDEAFARGYASLDPLYRRWVAGIGPDDVSDGDAGSAGPRTQARRRWQHEVRRELSALADAATRAAGTPAWIGRTVTIANKEQEMNTSIAHRSFTSSLTRVLDLAASATNHRAAS